ncbi:hypothetical protein CDIK_2110 [Cucumispora dikerogammari]|nr:hypothetical protein CDIK_2110 [Cucumispora dikerogammari]
MKIAAETFNIKYGTARNIICAFKKTGKLKKSKKGRSYRTKLLPDTLNKVEALISENLSLTLKELQSKIIESENPGFSISISTIERGLSELKITLKLVHRELDRVNSPEKIVERKNHTLWFNDHYSRDYSSVVFIDESSFNLHVH